MKKSFIANILGILLMATLSPVFAIAEDVTDLWNSAIESYNTKDYPRFETLMTQLSTARPYSLSAQKNLLRAYLLNNHVDQAQALLETTLAQKVYIDIAEDEDFKSIATDKTLAILSTALEPAGTSELHLEINKTGLLPEGVAWSPKQQSVYVASVRQGNILKAKPGGKTEEFIAPDGDNKLQAVFGLKIDEESNRLWLTTSPVGQHVGPNSASGNAAAVVEFDLTTGQFIKRHPVTDTGRHLLGDLILLPHGDIYATDSLSPIIYRLNRKSGQMEKFLESMEFVNLQGLCSPGDDNLFVSDYLKGIFHINLETKEVRKLSHGPDINVGGIDGLYCHGKDLIGIQNGITPHRIVKLSLEGDTIKAFTILANNLPQWDEPTLGKIVGNTLYYSATSQWGNYDENGGTKDENALLPILIMGVNVNSGF